MTIHHTIPKIVLYRWHPDDFPEGQYTEKRPGTGNKYVKPYSEPGIDPDHICKRCYSKMKDHGVITGMIRPEIICPGDFIYQDPVSNILRYADVYKLKPPLPHEFANMTDGSIVAQDFTEVGSLIRQISELWGKMRKCDREVVEYMEKALSLSKIYRRLVVAEKKDRST